MASLSITRALRPFRRRASGGTLAAQGVARARLLQGSRRADPPEQQCGKLLITHRPDHAAGGRPHQGLSARAQPDRSPGRALLLLLERAGKDHRRVRQQNAAAGAADQAVGAAQQDRRQQEAQKIYAAIRNRAKGNRCVDVIDIPTPQAGSRASRCTTPCTTLT